MFKYIFHKQPKKEIPFNECYSAHSRLYDFKFTYKNRGGSMIFVKGDHMHNGVGGSLC